MKDKCTCGKDKDKRAIQCRSCKDKEPEFKVCKKCFKLYPILDYPLRPNGRGGFKRRSSCRDCEAKYMREKRAKNPEYAKAIKKKYYIGNKRALKRLHLRQKFRAIGFDPDLGVKLFEEHSKVCDICGGTNNNGTHLAIDHCHTSSKLRGFLCSHCNTGLGYFRDNPEVMAKAIAYLKLHSEA